MSLNKWTRAGLAADALIAGNGAEPFPPTDGFRGKARKRMSRALRGRLAAGARRSAALSGNAGGKSGRCSSSSQSVL